MRPISLSALFAGLNLLLVCLGPLNAQDLSSQEVARLLAQRTTEVAGGADATANRRLLDKLSGVTRSDPAWPLYAFLRAELLLRMQLSKEAAEAYRSLVEHSASDPYKDTWGGNSLVAFALYRWLQIQTGSASTDPVPFDEMAKWTDKVLETRLVRSAFRPYAILSSMPLLEEQLYYALTREAMRVRAFKRAGTYFLNYLSRLQSKDVTPEAGPLYRVILDQRISTPDRIALLQGKRLVSVGQMGAALPHLNAASRSTHDQTRIEAMYLRARASGKTMKRAEKAAIYQEVQRYATDEDLAQAALLYEGLLYGPKEPEYTRILSRLVDEFPRGPSTDEALNWLSRGARITGDLDGALAWAAKLRQLHGQSPYLGSTAIHTALGLLWRGHPEDLDAATSVLNAFIDEQPNARDRARALFWLARIAEEKGNQPEAKRRFEDAAKADWFGYYGLRARMHMASGQAARSHVLIENQALAREIRAAYANSGFASHRSLPPSSVYHRRLQTALDYRIYQLSLEGEKAMRRASPSTRVQDLTFEDLDRIGVVAPIAVMMALRQDALAAADSEPSLPGRLALARLLGETTGDWPAVLSLVHPVSVRPAARRSELMRTPGYLRIAYPQVFDVLLREATAEYRVAPSVLYSVMRHESFFYPAALSSARALGLFQFTPQTFEDLNGEWRLLTGGAAPDRAAYLMNERLSIRLGARWFAEKKLPAFNGHPLLAVLAHHSGDNRVRTWSEVWGKRGWRDDIEMMIESFRMHDFIPEHRESWGAEAREFGRHVVADMAIVDAAKLYADRPGR